MKSEFVKIGKGVLRKLLMFLRDFSPSEILASVFFFFFAVRDCLFPVYHFVCVNSVYRLYRNMQSGFKFAVEAQARFRPSHFASKSGINKPTPR